MMIIYRTFLKAKHIESFFHFVILFLLRQSRRNIYANLFITHFIYYIGDYE